MDGLRVEQCCACGCLNGASSLEVGIITSTSLLFDTYILSLAIVKALGWFSEKLMSQSCYDLYVRFTLARIDRCVLVAAFQKKNELHIKIGGFFSLFF